MVARGHGGNDPVVGVADIDGRHPSQRALARRPARVPACTRGARRCRARGERRRRRHGAARSPERVRYDDPSRGHRALPLRQPDSHREPGVDAGHPAPVPIGRALRRAPARGVRARPAQQVVPWRRPHPAGELPRRPGRHRGDHPGHLDAQTGGALQPQGWRELERIRDRGTQPVRDRCPVGSDLQIGRRTRFQGAAVQRCERRWQSLAHRRGVRHQQRWPRQEVRARSPVPWARHALGLGNRRARRTPHRFGLRGWPGHPPVRDPRAVRYRLCRRLARAARRLGDALDHRRHRRRTPRDGASRGADRDGGAG